MRRILGEVYRVRDSQDGDTAVMGELKLHWRALHANSNAPSPCTTTTKNATSTTINQSCHFWVQDQDWDFFFLKQIWRIWKPRLIKTKKFFLMSRPLTETHRNVLRPRPRLRVSLLIVMLTPPPIAKIAIATKCMYLLIWNFLTFPKYKNENFGRYWSCLLASYLLPP